MPRNGGPQQSTNQSTASQTTHRLATAQTRLTDNLAGAAAEEDEGCEESCDPPTKQQQPQEKILITGDDVLIEYVHRMVGAMKSLGDSAIEPLQRSCVEKFVMHVVWHSKDLRRADAQSKLWQRLENRLIEMRDRRRRLVRNLYKKEGRLHEFEKGYEKSMR